MATASRHLRSSSAAAFWAASCSAVRFVPAGGAGGAGGAPRNASTGCVRSSTPLMPSSTQLRMMSSTGRLRPPKLYGTFMPIITPRTFEFGRAWKAASRDVPSTCEAGKAARARAASSRLV